LDLPLSLLTRSLPVSVSREEGGGERPETEQSDRLKQKQSEAEGGR
jgi:hypothetical protein